MTLRKMLISIGVITDIGAIKKTDSALDSVKGTATGLVRVLGRVAGALGVAFSIRTAIQMADEWSSVNARVKLTTNSLEEQKMVLKGIYDISQETRQSYLGTADLYSRVARGTKNMGLGQDKVLALTKAINEALIVGGGSSSENQAALMQFGQALGSGSLQGDEYRSIRENAPRLFEAIAKGMGKTSAEMKNLAKEGALTADVLIKAILSQADAINKEFKEVPMTVGQAVTKVSNSIGRFFSKLEEHTRVFSKLAKAIDAVSTYIDKLTDNMSALVTQLQLAAIFVASFMAAWGGMKIMAIVSGLMKMYAAIDLLVKGGALAFLRGALIASAKAAWLLVLPLLKLIAIAAIIAAIILLLEDLYHWVQGNESLIGDWLGSWDDFKKKAIEVFNDVKDWAVKTFKFLLTALWDYFISQIPVIKIGVALAKKADETFGISDKLNTFFNPQSPAQTPPGVVDRSVNIGEINNNIQTKSDNPATIADAAATGFGDALDDAFSHQLAMER